MAGDDRVRAIETPSPRSHIAIVTVIRNILHIAMTCKISSISVVLRYTKPTGESIYSTFEEIAPGEVEEFW